MKKMMSACLAALLLCLAAAFAAAEGNEPGQMSVTLYFRYAGTGAIDFIAFTIS